LRLERCQSEQSVKNPAMPMIETKNLLVVPDALNFHKLSPVSSLSRSLRCINVLDDPNANQTLICEEPIEPVPIAKYAFTDLMESMKFTEEDDDLLVRKQVNFDSPPSISISNSAISSMNTSAGSPYKTPKKNLLHSMMDDDSMDQPNVTSKDVENMRNFADLLPKKNFLTRSQSSYLVKKRRTNSFYIPKPDVQDLTSKMNPICDDKENFKPTYAYEQSFLNSINVSIPSLSAAHKSNSDSNIVYSPSKKEHSPNESQCKLPIIKGSHADLCTISHHTMRDILGGKYKDVFEEFHIIDCRFGYEYDGGHVQGAVNISNVKDLETNYVLKPMNKQIAIVFYCEFSSKRGPSGYRNLRTFDRKANVYPNLHYPEVYILEGGYKNFFENCKDLCEPQAYVEMKDKRFESDMKENCKELRQRSWKRSRSLTSAMLPLPCNNKQEISLPVVLDS